MAATVFTNYIPDTGNFKKKKNVFKKIAKLQCKAALKI